jgi:hypothetical protein
MAIALAMEIPAQYHDVLSKHTDLDFVICYQVLDDAKYAQRLALRPTRRELLLDNGTHETGHPYSNSDLLRAADMCRANIVIAPDIVNPTIDEKQHILNMRWLRETAHELILYRIGAVACFSFHIPERLSYWDDFAKSDLFITYDRVHLLGVSTLAELRQWVRISEQYPETEFSVDTSKPLKLASQDREIDEVSDMRGLGHSKTVLELNHLTDAQLRLTELNIRLLKSVCAGSAPQMRTEEL